MEQRRNDRVAPRELEPVEVQVMGDGFLDILFAKDIGQKGLGLYVPQNYTSAKIQCEVELIISVPGFKSFEASGTITHTGRETKPDDKKCTCIGIHFTKIAPQNKAILDNYFQKLLADNRDHVRVEPSTDNPIQAHAEINDTTENLFIKDISLSGIGIEGHPESLLRKCNSDDEIRFIINLPSGEKVPVNGKLKYTNEQATLFGLRFQEMEKEHAKVLKKYIASRIKERQQMVDFS